MTRWEVLKISPSPIQNRVALVNSDPTATYTTDYHQADALARRTLTEATLVSKGYGLMGDAIRIYASQAY